MARHRPQDPHRHGGVRAAPRRGADRLLSGEHRRLLVTDLDGTFIGDDDTTRRLWEAIDDAGIGLVFATGRHLDSVREFYRALDTDRRAAACICMEGTEVWLLRGRRYRLDDGWPQVIGAHWDRAAVVNAAEAAGRLILQHDQWQSEYKVSWFVEGDDPAAVVERVRRVLVARGLRARTVFSGRHLLDLIPSNAGQGSAAGFVARRLGTRAESVVTAGGSGSDLDMMRPGLGFKSIVVGNAEPELRDLRGDEIYQATQRRADGIAEGLQHFGWLGAV